MAKPKPKKEVPELSDIEDEKRSKKAFLIMLQMIKSKGALVSYSLPKK